VDEWRAKKRAVYDVTKFRPPGYGRHVMWTAHRVRSFIKLMGLKPTTYDANLRILASKAGMHPYDFRWNMNPLTFATKHHYISKPVLMRTMGVGYQDMENRLGYGY